MPRPISWHRNLNKIHRSVSESSRTPYTRGDFESLFDLKTAGAKDLMQLIPRTQQGNAFVVERLDLLEFLSRAMDAEDLKTYLDEIRKKPPKASRRKVRLFIPHSSELRFPNLKMNQIYLNPGTLEMTYTTFDDFLSKLSVLISMVEEPSFERRYCQPPATLEMKRSPREQAISEDSVYFAKVRKLHRIADALVAASEAGDRTKTRRLLKLEAAAFADLQTFCVSTDRQLDDVYLRAHLTIQGRPIEASEAKPRELDPSPLQVEDRQTPSQSSIALPAAGTSLPAVPANRSSS